MNMIEQGLAFLNSQLKANAATDAVYRRGPDSVPLKVVIEAARISPLTLLAGAVADRDMTQPSPEHVDHSFSFTAEDLVIGGELATPDDGDVLELTISGELRSYRLSPTHDGERTWKYANGYESGPHARIFINTRLMAVDPV